MDSPPPILIIGTGALACLFAARFLEVEVPVTILGTWPEGVAALRSSGVTLVETNGRKHSYPVQVITNPKDCVEVDLALVLVKSWQTKRAARQLQACLPSQGQVLTLQNGLGNRQELAQFLGMHRVFQGVTTVGGTLLGPGRVGFGGEGLISLEANPLLAEYIEIFQRADFMVEKTSNIEALIWGKLAVSAAINPLTAILGVSNGVLLAHPQTRKLMRIVATEVATIAGVLGVQLPFDDVAAAVEDVARRTAANHSSMLQDMKRGAPTEIEAINGAVVQTANRVGVSAPVNQTLYLLVKSMVDIKSKKSAK